MFPQSFKGRAFRALCHDGQVRRAVCTASQPWCWDAISAAVQVSFCGKRLTVSGNLSGLDRALHPDAPPGVSHRFFSEDLRTVLGWTAHKPVAPDLRKAAARLLGRFVNLPGALSWYYLAEDLRAVAASRGLVKPEDDPLPEQWRQSGGPLLRGAVRLAVARLSDKRLARFARLAWAFRAWKLATAETALGRTERRAWSDHRI